MLVPAMTLEEIRREVEKDFPIVHRKSSYVSNKMKRIFRDSLRQGNVVRFFDYVSKQKNKWIYKIELSNKPALITFMAYYYGAKGLNAVMMISDNNMLYFSAHFFNRYNERRKLNLAMPHDIIRSFMSDNLQFSFKKLEEISAGVYTFFGVTDSGVALGTYYQNANLYKMNTFITSDMLTGNQVAMEEQLKARLVKYGSKAVLPE